MFEPAVPSEGLGVVHLFWKVTPLTDREAILQAVKDATVDDDQVVTVAMLGHKADLATMALGKDLWRLRHFQTALASAGLELVDSYVKLKLGEWKSYATSLSQWERDHTLDC